MRNVNRIFLILIGSAVFLTALSLFISSGTYVLQHSPDATDFLAFYTGAHLLMHHPSVLYNLQIQEHIQQQIDPFAKSANVFLPFLNPPFVALLFIPLLLLGLQNAYIAWIVINMCILLTVCYFTYRLLQGQKLYFKIVVIGGMVTFIPVLTAILIGQLSLLLSLFVLLSWIAYRQKKNFLSGLLFSLLLIKPNLIILPTLAVLIRKDVKFLGGFLTGIFLLSIISIEIIGIKGITSYINLLSNATSWNAGYGIDLFAQHSLQTLFLILFQTQSLTVIHIPWLIAITLLSLPTLYIWLKQFPSSSPFAAFQFALLIVASLLISPHTHFHDLYLLVVPAIVIFSTINKLKPKQQKFFIILIIAGYLIELAGFISDMQLHPYSRFVWIVVSVSYMVVLWFMLAKTLLKLSKDTL